MTFQQVRNYLMQFNVNVSRTKDGYFRVLHNGNLWHYASSLEEAMEVGKMLAHTDDYGWLAS